MLLQRIINKTKGTVLAQNAVVADSFLVRLIGLMGQKQLPPERAMILSPCTSIHTFFMRFDIDVLFVDKDNKVIGVCVAMKPWRVSPVYWKSKFVVELPSGMIASTSTALSDEISLL